jgi:hypothetical protein
MGIREKLPNELDTSEERIGRIITKLGYTRKRLQKSPTERNSDQVINQRDSYCEAIDNIPNSGILFLDETGFNLHTSYNYGYSPEGTPAIMCTPGNRGRNLSLIVTISLGGVVPASMFVQV